MRVAASPVVPHTTKPSEPCSARWCISATNASSSTRRLSSNGVTIAVRMVPSGLIVCSIPLVSGVAGGVPASLTRPRTTGAPGPPWACSRSVRTPRIASSTPGMKDSRPVVSWRIVSVWASSPRMTSWLATRPGRRTEWIGGGAPPEDSAISCAVRAAVPLGASSLRSWCSSMISALAMCLRPRPRSASSGPRRSRSWALRARLVAAPWALDLAFPPRARGASRFFAVPAGPRSGRPDQSPWCRSPRAPLLARTAERSPGPCQAA